MNQSNPYFFRLLTIIFPKLSSCRMLYLLPKFRYGICNFYNPLMIKCFKDKKRVNAVPKIFRLLVNSCHKAVL